jgi:hypothetical protein
MPLAQQRREREPDDLRLAEQHVLDVVDEAREEVPEPRRLLRRHRHRAAPRLDGCVHGQSPL